MRTAGPWRLLGSLPEGLFAQGSGGLAPFPPAGLSSGGHGSRRDCPVPSTETVPLADPAAPVPLTWLPAPASQGPLPVPAGPAGLLVNLQLQGATSVSERLPVSLFGVQEVWARVCERAVTASVVRCERLSSGRDLSRCAYGSPTPALVLGPCSATWYRWFCVPQGGGGRGGS